MKNLNTAINHLLPVLLAALMCASCSAPKVRVTAQDVAALAGSPQPPIPLRAGLFTPEDLKNFNWTEAVGRGKSDWLTGVEIRAMIEQAAPRIFKEVVLVTAAETPKDFQAKNLDVIVSVGSINISETPVAGSRIFGERLYGVDVVAQWDISSPDGKRIFFCKPTGHGETKMPFPMGRTTAMELMKRSYVAAFDDQFKKAAAEITGSGWWKDTSWRTK
jgi:hypothetical protein